MCMGLRLWGKAQSYLEASLSVQPTHEAHLVLASLFGWFAPGSEVLSTSAIAITGGALCVLGLALFVAALFALGRNFRVGLDETPQPQPYSKSAWANGALAGESEPQAEGAAAFDEMFGGTPSGSGETQNPSAFDEEPREWEPEREPEMGDVPTVSQFVPKSGEGEGVTLDQLLEEIIKAGE